MALNWDDLINSRQSSFSRPSWDDLVNSRRNYNNQPTSYERNIPSGYEGTEYEGMTNDEIVQRVAEKQKVYNEEEKQRRQAEVEKAEARNRAIAEAERVRNEQRQKEEIDTMTMGEKSITQPIQNEQPQSKGWFLDLAKGIKDTIASIPTSAFSIGAGIGKKLAEADKERKEAINTNEETKNLSVLEKTGLFIADSAADLVRDVGNGYIGTAINILNFLDPDKNKSYYEPLSIDALGIKDFSPIKNNEQFGQYESKEALEQAIQKEKQETYKSLGIYNPTANTIGEIATNVLEFAALKKAGLSNTSSAVTSSVVNTLGNTGDISQAIKSGISSYVFGEMLSNNTLQQMIKNPTATAVSKVSNKLFDKFPSLADSNLAIALDNTLPNIIGNFNASFATRATAGIAGAVIEGEDMDNSDTYKKAIGNALLWTTIYEGLNGVAQVKYEFNRAKLDSNNARAQLKEWYNILGTDSKTSDEELKTIYRKLAKANHPDRGGDEELFKKITMAYDGITEYRKSGNVYQTTIKETKTKVTPEDLTKQGYTPNGKELWVKGNSIVVNTSPVLSDVYTAVTNAQNTIIPITSGNEVVGLQKTTAVPFEVKNSKVPEIQPAVTMNDNHTYNTIDTNTGTTLITNKPTAQSAISETTKVLQNADSITQKEIQTNLDQSKMATKAAVDQLKDAINTGIAEVNAKNMLTHTQANEVDDTATKINETTNYIPQQNKTIKSEPSCSTFANYDGKSKIENSDFANSIFDDKKQYKADDIQNYYYEHDELISTTDGNYIDIKKVTENNKDYVEIGEYNEEDELVDKVYIEPNSQGMIDGSAINTAVRHLTTDTSSMPINGQIDIEGNQVQGKAVTENKIQGLEDYSRSDIKAVVSDYIREKLGDNEMTDIEIIGAEIIGSRNRGDAKNTSDLDIVVEYKGDVREDTLFDILNEDPLEINGIKVDINPITADKTGTLKEYLQQSNKYDKELLNNKNEFLLNNYDDKTKKTILMNERNVIVRNNAQLERFVVEALNSQSNKALHLGKITEQQTEKIKNSISNLPVDKKNFLSKKDYDIVINQSEIRHLKDNKVRLTENDIIDYVKKIPEIVSNFDEVYYSKNNKNEGIKFAKKINDAKYYSFTLVSNKKGTLTVKSTSMNRQDFENKKRGVSPKNDGTNVPPNKTSKTNGASTSIINNSVSQQQKNVKSNTITNNMQEKSKNIQDVRTMQKNNSKIADFGEKIGGARKDLSTKTGTKSSKEVIHDYTISQSENGYAVNFKNKVLKDGFKTQGEAEKYILDFKESIKSNQAFVEEGVNRDGETIYMIKIRNQRTLKSAYTTKSFKNKQEAESYALALSMYLKEHNKNLFRPTIQKVERVNANSKNATKTTGDDILNNFGFRGGEFGNWVSQTERQQFLNYAQDAFTDLAEALGVTPKSLGQKGAMGIAFGARGQGLIAANAHFEPGKKVINMTRLKGAGSLAHEYGHSIDNYLSREGGYNPDGMATKNYINPKLSNKMRAAIKDVTDAIDYSVSTDDTEVAKKNEIYERNRKESLQYHMGYMDKVFNGEANDYKYNRKTKKRELVAIEVTKEQKAQYQKIKKILEDGKLEDKRTFIGNSLSSNNFEYAKPLEDLKSLYKEVVGRKANDDTIYWLYRYGQPAKQIKEVRSESAYSKSAKELDRMMGRATPYFSTEVEKWARAFECYINDKLKEKDITNTYLVHSVYNEDYALFNPYPAGEERKIINKAFDNLIGVMKKEGLFVPKATKAEAEKQDNGIRYLKRSSNKTKEFKQNLSKQFENMTGDTILLAGAKLGGIELRNRQRELGNLQGEKEENPYSKEAMEIYKEYNNSQKTSSYLYHATSMTRLKSIMEKGLTTGNEQNQKGISAIDKIYLSANPELAESYAPIDSVILRINPKFYDKLENFEEDFLGGKGSYSITNNIPADMLQIKEDGKWISLIEAKEFSNIRHAKKTENSEPGRTNAERADSYIEQEIQKLEKTGGWDSSIPITRRTDIRKTIEDYLGLGIKRGRFRESAYGIYKTGRDVIRTKELKDMDSILHETGHALDLGNRLQINKESLANELIDAVNAYGEYQDESRTIQLDEGFAEIVREYAVLPAETKAQYPNTVAVLEGIRQKDKGFNKFITKLQEQTYNYIHQNPKNRNISNLSIGEQTDKQKWSKEWIKQEVMKNVYDKDWVLKSAVNELAKAGNKTLNQVKPSDNAYYLTRLASGIGDKVTSMLSDGYIDENGNKVISGLGGIGDVFETEAKDRGLKGKARQDFVKDRFNDLRAYLISQRDLEYKAKTLKTGLRENDSKAVVDMFRNDKQIQETAKMVYDTLDGVLQYAVDNGLINEETASSLRESNAFYVPFQRVIEGQGNDVGRKGAVSEIIKKRTGSELDIKDVLENIVTNSSNIIQQVENNNVLKALYKQGESVGLTGSVYDVISSPMVKVGTAKMSTWKDELRKQGVSVEKIDFDKTIDLFAPSNKIDRTNLITSFINDNGARVYLQFYDEDLFNSVMGLDKQTMSKVLKINSKFNMLIRFGATMGNLGFAIPNVISDTIQAAVFSEAGFIPVVNNAMGIIDVLSTKNATANEFLNTIAPDYTKKINDMYSLYKQSGAQSATRLSQYRDSTQNIMKDVYGTKNSERLGIKEKYKPLKRILDLLAFTPEVSEKSTRFEVFVKNYEMYKKKGMSEKDARIKAALDSRDATQDFGRTGNITREINQLIPFSAARVGSAYTFAEKVKANPKRTAFRIAILSAVAMLVQALGYDDKEIEELNQRKKDDNFVLKIGENVITVKKPQGILRSIVNLTEYIQDLFTGHIDKGKEGQRLGEWLNNAIMDNMPADSVTGLVPNMIAPLIENAINKDFYYNTDIVKSYDLNLPDAEQYYEYNSQLAILLGKVFNYSPAKIDNLVSSWFGGLGTQLTGEIDSFLGKLGVIAEKPNMGAEQDAVGKRFIVNVNNNSQSVDDVYNLKTELTKKKNGGTITEEEENTLANLTQATSTMSNYNKQIKAIKKDLTMSGDEKAEKIRELQKQKTDAARDALGKDLIYKNNEEKLEEMRFYPNDTLSLNSNKLALTEEMKGEYMKLANEYYKQYEKTGLYDESKLKTKAKDYAKKQLMEKYENQVIKKK